MPNVLDENVVILKFDNSNFKKNTADSVKSIENLKSSLKNVDSGENLSKIGRAANHIDLSGLGRSIDTINKRFSLMGIVGMSAINKLTTSAMSSAARITKAIPNQIIQGGWRRALNIEQAEFLMEGLGHKFEGTYDKVTKEFTGIKGAVLAAVDRTRYGLDEAAKIGAQLMASGVTDANELARRLKSISGLASVANKEFFDIGRIFTQVAGQGRVMGDDLLQISERGINAAAKIKEYLNANGEIRQQALDNAIAQGKQVKAMKEIATHAELTEGDIRDMVSAGAISFDIFASSFEDFFDQAQKANNTYDGSLANVKAAFSRMGEQLEAPKLKNLTRIFNTLLPILNKFEDFISPFTTKIAEASNKVTDFINEGILNPIGKAIGVEPDKLFHGIAEEINKAGEESETAGEKTQSLGDKIRVTAKEWQAALDIWNKGTYGNGQKRADAIRELGMSYENVQGIINKFYKNGFDWDKTKSEYSIDDQVNANSKVAKTAEEATDRLHEQTKTLSTLGKVIKGTINFIKAFSNTMKALKNIASGVWKSLKGMVSTIGGGLMTGYLKLSEKVLDLSKAFLALSQVINGELKISDLEEDFPRLYAVLTRLQNPLKMVSNAFARLKQEFGVLKGYISSSGVFDKLQKSLSKLGKTIFGTILAGIDKIQDGFSNLGKHFEFGGGGIAATIGRFFTGLVNGISNFINALAGGQRVAGSFMSFLGSMANKIIGFFKPVVSFLADTFFIAIQNVVDFFMKLGESEGITKLKDSILELCDAFQQTEKPMNDVVAGMSKISGATQTGGGIGKVVDFFSNMASSLADFINAVAKGEGPLDTFFLSFKKTKQILSPGGFIDYIKNTIGYSAGEGIGHMIKGLSDMVSQIKIWLVDIGALEKLTKAADVVLDGLGSLVKIVQKIDFNKVLTKIVNAPWEKIGKTSVYFAGAISMLKMALDMGKVARSAAGMFSSIGGAFKAFGSIADTIKTSIKMKSFETLAISVAILIGAIIALAMVPTDRIKPALAAVAIIMGALTGIVIAMSSEKFDAEKLRAIGVAFAGVGVSVFLIATSMAMIARMKISQIIKAGVVISAFMLIMVLMSRKAKEMTGVGAAFMGLGVALNLLATAILAFAMMPFGVLIKGGTAVLTFMFAMALAAKVANQSKPGGFLAMAVALNLLIPALVLMALIPAEMLIKGGFAVSALMYGLAKTAKATGGGELKNLGKMAIVIGTLAAACLVLSFVSPERLLASALAISGMMTALGFAAKGANGATKGILSLALVISVVAGALIALEKLAPETATKNALAMSVFVASIGGILAIFAKLKVNPESMAGAAAALAEGIGIVVGAMLTIAGVFAGIGAVVEKFGGEGALEKAKSYAFKVAEVIGSMVAGFITPIREALNSTKDVDQQKTQFQQLVESMTELCDVVGKMGKGKLAKLTEFASAMKELKGADLRGSIADAIDAFSGGGDKSLTDTITDFTGGITALMDGLKEFNDEDMSKATAASKVFAAFAHGMHEMPATFGLSTIWSNKQLGGFGGFSSQMVDFGEDMKDFIDAMDQVKLDKLQGLMNKGGKFDLLMKLVTEMATVKTPESGVTNFVDGVTPINTFASQMVGFGAHMINFIKEMDQVPLKKLQGLFHGGEDSKIKMIGKVIAELSEMGASLAPSGGLKQAYEGNTTLAEFMEQLADPTGTTFGSNLKSFLDSMKEVKADELQDVVDNKLSLMKDLIKGLGEAASVEMPETGGVLQWLDGEQNLGDFGTKLGEFGAGFAAFHEATKDLEIDDTFTTKIQYIATATQEMAGIMPPQALFIEAIAIWAKGKIIGAGITNMVKVVKRIADSGIESDITDKIGYVSDACEELKKIKPPSEGFLDAIKRWAEFKIDSSTITTLVTNINKISKQGGKINTAGIKTFSSSVSSIKTTVGNFKAIGKIPTGANLITLARNVKKFSDKMTDVDTSGIAAKAKTVASSAKTLGKASSKALESSSGGSSKVGAEMGSSYAKGISSKGKNAASAASSLASKAVKALRSGASGTYGLGQNVGQGFVNGIRSYLSKVWDAGYQLGRKAVSGGKAGIDAGSPSKEFNKLGKWSGEGYIIGIRTYSDKVYKSGYELGANSIRGANDALAMIDEFGSPTITPVMDLTEVERGVNTIDAMMSSTNAMAVSANMQGTASNYATSSLVEQLLDKFNDMTENALTVKVNNDDGLNGATVYNNITVDGSSNPEDFANRFITSLQQELRTV